MEPADWKKIWIESQSKSFMDRRRPDRRQWSKMWDENAGEFLERVKKDEPYYRKIVSHLRKEGIFRKGDAVLDIACGPGTYSLLFAREAGAVTALDISRGMLDTLAAEATARGLRNISTIHGPWEDYPQGEQFDLAFTALSPAVTGPETFLKMEAHSRRSCCFITFGKGLDRDLRDEMHRLLSDGAPQARQFDISIPENLLKSMGRNARVKCFERPYLFEAVVDELLANNLRFFGMFLDVDEVQRGRAREYLESMAVDGVIRLKGKRSLAAVYWDVP